MVIFATSIACAVKESELNSMARYPSFVNPGSFAAACVSYISYYLNGH
jgi:hypothetical protein